MNENRRQKDFFWGAFVGGAMATLSVLLFTTKKGKQLQHKIENLYDEVKDKVKDTFFEVKDKTEETAEQAKEAVQHGEKKMASKIKNNTSHEETK